MQQLLGGGWRSNQVRLSDFKTNANDSTPRVRPQRKLQLKVNERSEAKHRSLDFVHGRLKLREADIMKINSPFIKPAYRS